ncbi:hypothetical protein PPYR_15246 [Photinus pyralis]|uniref:DDE-1 domain-containing protein n=1 Tax=Photinus pyralis TaxID=7054 RepID=A0A5N3ZZ92_PHOPY|nr:jerky protein homolog-like [Photinus pyralis]KAB0790382.1 hypothetical protein PPYR_15246 [Photinus pyralis]
MTQDIFKHWFFKQFVPEVTAFLKSTGLPVKAVLILDNAPSHPSADELKTPNGAIFTMFMPPNVTPLIQPMDQNVLRLTKLYYRKSLLSSVVSKGEGVAEALKTITLKDAIIHLHKAWWKLDPLMITKCWNPILGKNEDQDNIPLATLRKTWTNETEKLNNDTICLLEAIEPAEYTQQDVEEWNKDVIDNDGLESEDSADSENSDCEVISTEEKKISHVEVLEALKAVSQWSIQNLVDVSDMVALKKIEEKAVMLNITQNKIQTKITSYFK